MNKKGVTVLGVIFALIFLLTASIYFIKPVSAPYSESDFLTLEENTAECLINCYALIKIKNPTPSSITLSSNDFTKWYVKAPGAQDLADFHLEIEKNNSRIVPVYQTTCNPYDITNPNQSISHYDNCTTIQTGTNTEYYTTFEPWNPGGFTLEANKQYRIKIVGTKSIAKKGNTIDWKIRLQTPQGTFEPNWDWWNTNWQYKACLNISNQDNETML
ncbi:hypothetical protein HYX19_05110, partial [Candidatus Woesearchaeota archaeon]|nr:hypothetical protein [Candidatus Woesearchaeota archaeon]